MSEGALPTDRGLDVADCSEPAASPLWLSRIFAKHEQFSSLRSSSTLSVAKTWRVNLDRRPPRWWRGQRDDPLRAAHHACSVARPSAGGAPGGRPSAPTAMDGSDGGGRGLNPLPDEPGSLRLEPHTAFVLSPEFEGLAVD